MATRYPTVRDLLEKEFSRLRKSRPKLTGETIAKGINVSPAALSSWRLGHRAPKDKNIRELAKYLYPGAENESEPFIQRLTQAVKEDTSAPSSAETFDAADGLNFSYVSFGVFASDPDGSANRSFLVRLFERFVSLTRQSDPRRSSSRAISPADVGDSLSGQQAKAVLGLLATPDRLAHVQFLLTPITVGVNGVVGRHLAEDERGRMQEILGGGMVSDRQVEKMRPLVHEEEVGDLYTSRALGWPDEKLERHPGEFSADEFAEMLSRRVGRSRDEPLMVGIFDEYSCLEIMAKLKERGEKGSLVFRPLNNELPRYPLGIGLRRGDHATRAYVEEALSTFLDADYEWVASQYRDLFGKLKEHAEKGGQNAADASQWAIKTLRLGDARRNLLLVPQAWRRALEHADILLRRDREYQAAMRSDATDIDGTE